MILGDMPPYEAFALGGTNSVRGYAEGAVGSARNFVTGTAEVRWPLFGPFEVDFCLDFFSLFANDAKASCFTRTQGLVETEWRQLLTGPLNHQPSTTGQSCKVNCWENHLVSSSHLCT